ncbi:MAG: hypothetical protein WD768_04270 [Phycisphaeraceae bacterium]
MHLANKRNGRKPVTQKQPPMLSWKKICEQYPSTWVLLAEPKTNKWQKVTRGRVVAHGQRDETCRMISALGLKSSAILYTGSIKLPPKTAFMLSIYCPSYGSVRAIAASPST